MRFPVRACDGRRARCAGSHPARDGRGGCARGLLLGSGAAGPLAQVFLGSAASRILRHAPVPVMILPRQQELDSRNRPAVSGTRRAG
ncbi:universal stress protein [Nonomuraea sp. NPDC050691]|uniref:universal stress protein n=1 Tax=Nonomuraea sp. NPDC050691 TaxID=3155661 RepID=UPI0033F51D82